MGFRDGSGISWTKVQDNDQQFSGMLHPVRRGDRGLTLLEYTPSLREPTLLTRNIFDAVSSLLFSYTTKVSFSPAQAPTSVRQWWRLPQLYLLNLTKGAKFAGSVGHPMTKMLSA